MPADPGDPVGSGALEAPALGSKWVSEDRREGPSATLCTVSETSRGGQEQDIEVETAPTEPDTHSWTPAVHTAMDSHGQGRDVSRYTQVCAARNGTTWPEVAADSQPNADALYSDVRDQCPVCLGFPKVRTPQCRALPPVFSLTQHPCTHNAA